MQGSDWGLIGGTVGGVLGLLGGLVGTYAELRRAKSERERRFILGFVAFVLFLVTALLLGTFCLPAPYGALLLIPYLAVLLPASFWASRHMKQLREKAGERTT